MSTVNNKGRKIGNSITKELTPIVTLESVTENPVGTLFAMWFNSRHEDAIYPWVAQSIYEDMNKGEVKDYNVIYNDGVEVNDYILDMCKFICDCYPEHAGDTGRNVANVIKEVAKMNLLANVPSAESVLFNFRVDNCTVALREQMVRTKVQSFWTQTSRTTDLSRMDVNMSESIRRFGGEEAVKIYEDAVQNIRDTYTKLTELGVPSEDIRLSPESRVHRVEWMTNVRALIPIVSKRVGWIAQLGLWKPIIEQVSEILRNLDPMFEDFLGNQEAVKIADGKVVFHKYDNEHEDRYFGRDPLPTDPLWLAYKGVCMPEGTNLELYDAMKEGFIKLWKQEALDVLGWDRRFPKKLGKYDRPRSYFIEHRYELPTDVVNDHLELDDNYEIMK